MGAPEGAPTDPALGQSDIDRGLAAVTTAFEVVGDLLAIGQGRQAGALDSRDVHEGILATGVGGDEAEALGRVIEFYGAIDHVGAFQFGSKRSKRAGFPRALRIGSLRTFAFRKESQATG
eukprot:TRINITY_DN68727_c0_g1_i1.p2 TRINITY_DN68727_c0_g1~~TRINITY_DN68727_c0_g1_i1.p2  ORF type:complete len:120 (-),score=8.53 TRINITY_DN68727_c0_g1_i1:25-384(-)